MSVMAVRVSPDVVGGIVSAGSFLLLLVGVMIGSGYLRFVPLERGETSFEKSRVIEFSVGVTETVGKRIGLRVLMEAMPVRLTDEFMEAAVVKIERIVSEESKLAGKNVEMAMRNTGV
jgi:hypothetical protein